MKHWVALATLAIALFGAAVMTGIYFATEPGIAVRERSAPAADAPEPLAAVEPANVATFALPTLPPLPGPLPVLEGPASTPSPEWRQENPFVPAPVENASAPIAAAPPPELPEAPAAREDAILELRRRRFADQMNRLNQRGVQRGGVPAQAGARPPQRVRPSDRRASLSAEN